MTQTITNQAGQSITYEVGKQMYVLPPTDFPPYASGGIHPFVPTSRPLEVWTVSGTRHGGYTQVIINRETDSGNVRNVRVRSVDGAAPGMEFWIGSHYLSDTPPALVPVPFDWSTMLTDNSTPDNGYSIPAYRADDPEGILYKAVGRSGDTLMLFDVNGTRVTFPASSFRPVLADTVLRTVRDNADGVGGYYTTDSRFYACLGSPYIAEEGRPQRLRVCREPNRGSDGYISLVHLRVANTGVPTGNDAIRVIDGVEYIAKSVVDADIATLSGTFHAAAQRENLCGVYDRTVGEVNRATSLLKIGDRPTVRNYLVQETLTVRRIITVPDTTSIEDGQRRAGEWAAANRPALPARATGAATDTREIDRSASWTQGDVTLY